MGPALFEFPFAVLCQAAFEVGLKQNVDEFFSRSDQAGPTPEDRWQNAPYREAPELLVDDGCTLVLNGYNPHEVADFPTFSVR